MDKVERLLERSAQVAIWLYLLLVVGWMPFYFTKGYGRIGSDKGNLYRTVVAPILILALVLWVLNALMHSWNLWKKSGWKAVWGHTTQNLSATDLLMLWYLIGVMLSFSLREYRIVGLWGHDPWPMGLLTHVCMVVSYFVISRYFTGEKFFCGLLLAVTTVVFGLGILNRYGVYPIPMEYANPSFISTVGNINWFCGYWSVTAWLGAIFYWAGEYGSGTKGRWIRIGLGCLSTIALALGIVQGSDSGMITLAVVLLTLFCSSIRNAEKFRRSLELLLMVCGICIAVNLADRLFPGALTYKVGVLKILAESWIPWAMGALCLVWYIVFRRHWDGAKFSPAFWKKSRKAVLILLAVILGLYVILGILNTALPGGVPGLAGKALFTFDGNWGSSRGITWAAGIKVWEGQDLLHKLVGVGPDNMADYIYRGGDPALRQTLEGWFEGNRLYNAHGEWITNLANLGLFGMVTFANVILYAFYKFFKAGPQNKLMYFLAISVLSYTVNNIFSFQTMMNLPQIFVLIAVGEALLRKIDVAKKGR